MTKSNKGFYRDKSKFNPEVFCDDLNVTLKSYFQNIPAFTQSNFNDIFENFTNLITKVIDVHAPLKKYSRKQRKLLNKPWITKGILVSIRKKRIMFKSCFINGDETQKLMFKQYSNKLTKVKSLSKKLYFKNELSDHSGNPKKNLGNTSQGDSYRKNK